MDEQPRYPVVIITGFLGSGKTTLLNRLLASPAMTDTAVIVNEFGEIALDHLLVESSIENALVLRSGCICCTVRGDLIDTIMDLTDKAARHVLPPFSRIVIETTGLAEPGPIIHTLATEPLLRERCHAQCVITTVDCVNGLDQLERFAEPARQIALADIILLTKSDIAPAANVAALRTAAQKLNPSAELHIVVAGENAPEVLLARGELDADAPSHRIAHWLGAHAGHEHSHSPHDGGIRAHCIEIEKALPWQQYREWLQSIISLRGTDILRLKGVLDVAGEKRPVVIQGVHHLLHPPTHLERWPEDGCRTRIVIIGERLSTTGLKASLLAAGGTSHAGVSAGK